MEKEILKFWWKRNTGRSSPPKLVYSFSTPLCRNGLDVILSILSLEYRVFSCSELQGNYPPGLDETLEMFLEKWDKKNHERLGNTVREMKYILSLMQDLSLSYGGIVEGGGKLPIPALPEFLETDKHRFLEFFCDWIQLGLENILREDDSDRFYWT